MRLPDAEMSVRGLRTQEPIDLTETCLILPFSFDADPGILIATNS